MKPNAKEVLQTMLHIIDEFELQSVIGFSHSPESSYIQLHDVNEINKFDSWTVEHGNEFTWYTATFDGIDVIVIKKIEVNHDETNSI